MTVTEATEVHLTVFYRRSRIKECLKEGQALRIELVCRLRRGTRARHG
jgi:hypothetical protein